MTEPLAQSYSLADVCTAWNLSPDHVRTLWRTGQVGYIKAGRGRRFLPEHIAQLRDVLEVKPRQPTHPGALFGQTTRSAAARRRKSA